MLLGGSVWRRITGRGDGAQLARWSVPQMSLTRPSVMRISVLGDENYARSVVSEQWRGLVSARRADDGKG